MTPLAVFSIDLLSDNMLLMASLLVFAAVLITKIGSKLGTPSLLLFLLLGMIAGRDVLGLTFDNYKMAESIGHFSMTVILFSAGLETSIPTIRPVLRQGILLSTAGVLITVVLTGLFIYSVTGSLLHMPMLGCFLLAAVMGSTDSASVFSILRGKKLHLREKLGPMLELESGSNDPMAFTLTLLLVELMTTPGLTEKGGWSAIGAGLLILALQLSVGTAVGVGVGFVTKWVLDKVRYTGFALPSILILSTGFFANGLAQLLHGNGLLAIYIAAIIIGNKARLFRKKEVFQFFDGLTWLMQMVMFLILGLLARPSQMLPMLWPAIQVGLFMTLVGRPASVFLCLLPFRKISARAKTFVSWVGLKGAGPILFALYPVVAGLEDSTEIFNIVFVITLLSLLIQGGSLDKVAKRLRLSYDMDPIPETFGMEVPEAMGMLRDHIVTEEDLVNGDTLRSMRLPHGVRVMMVRRDERFLVPHGSMKLEPGDKLVIIIGDSDD